MTASLYQRVTAGDGKMRLLRSVRGACRTGRIDDDSQLPHCMPAVLLFGRRSALTGCLIKAIDRFWLRRSGLCALPTRAGGAHEFVGRIDERDMRQSLRKIP